MGKDITKQRLVKDRALREDKGVAARTILLRKTACLPGSLRTVNSMSVSVRPGRDRWKHWQDRLTEARTDQYSLFSSYWRQCYDK